MNRKSPVAAAVVVLALVFAGCGSGSGSKSNSSPPTGTTTASAGGTTSSTPSTPAGATTSTETIPTSVAPTSVRGTLDLVWGLIRSGAFPSAATRYDQRIARVLGGRVLLAALRAEQGSWTQAFPIIDGIEQTKLGVLVRVHKKLPAGKKQVYGSYLLRQLKRGAYVVTYDSFLSNGILAIVRDTEQRKFDPKAKRASPRAVTAAKAAVARYDATFGGALSK